jgi:pimeloyl-ACP methyl ester carboxylesterase
VLAYLAMMDVGREPDGSYSDATFGSNGLPVSCADWPVHDADRLVPSASVLEENPLWAFVEAGTHNRCDGWTGKPRSTLIVFADATTPILVIGNNGDLVTPIEGTQAFAKTLVRSRLVTVDADGHGAYGSGNSCADDAVDTYLVDAIAPKNHTFCKAD